VIATITTDTAASIGLGGLSFCHISLSIVW
jgi:hypothetical protein